MGMSSLPEFRSKHDLLTLRSATITYNGQTYPIDNHLGVIPTAHTLHYDPSHYTNPAKFHPERFLDPSNAIPRSHFRTFGRGPRACLGQNLAQDELRIILLMTARDYEFECAGLNRMQNRERVGRIWIPCLGILCFRNWVWRPSQEGV
jgi:cytochrome P450